MTDRKTLDAECYDCGLPYASARFEDLLLADDIWKEISPDENGNGLLCPNCIIGRLNISGLHDPTARFVSGPLAGKSE
jgi:hypothetical protein